VTRTQESAPDDTAVIPMVPLEDDETDRDDGLATELAKAAPRNWWNRGTLVLGVLALLLGGFLGGVQVQKTWGTTTAAATASNARGGFNAQNRGTGGAGYLPGFTGGGQQGGAAPTAAAAAAGTSGTVQLVDGDTIYLKTADGTVVTVKTDAKTAVRTATKSTLKAVKTGDTVTVQGTPDATGNVTATTVTADRK
jgi:hypothetical protein